MNLRTLAANLQGVRFNIYLPVGQVLQLGQDDPAIDWHVHSERTLSKILRNPRLEPARSYLRGDWDVDTSQLPVLLLALAQASTPALSTPTLVTRLRHAWPAAQRAGPAPPRWQDTDLWLSRICLGEELFQGCAHYSEPGISLEQAQRVRCRELAARLRLEPGQHLLDISAGWGALPLYLAEHTGVRVTGLVTTREQLQYAHSEARRRGLSATVHFRLGGVHRCQGRFDRILGCELSGQNRRPALRALIEHLAGLLTEDGMLWLQLTGRREHDRNKLRYPGPWPTVDTSPPLSALHSALEQAQLCSLLQENLSDYLLKDLHTRARRFHHRRAAIARRFGERCTRYWELRIACEIIAVQTRQVMQYELVLGRYGAHWPGPGNGDESRLPLEITRRIPGLARDI
jgi:cyclopropane-fatty-acyl-phospholipid synthase